jgi:hypothetical protein
VFSAGNVVTGKGNIVASRRHSMKIGEHVAGAYLGLEDPKTDAVAETVEAGAAESAEKVVAEVTKILDPVREETRAALLARVQARQSEVGYPGDVRTWVAAHPPPA